MSNINVQNAGQINIADLTHSGGSIQMQFAALQMVLAQSNKEKAQAYIDDITASQQKSKDIADMISKARELQSQAKSADDASIMPPEMLNFFKDNGLSYEGELKEEVTLMGGGGGEGFNNILKGVPGSTVTTSYEVTQEQWDYNIKSLQNYQETIGTNTQQQMVFVQDFMGQYNSYLTGANSAIQQSNQTLSTIARGQ
jgi:hypothetical protein